MWIEELRVRAFRNLAALNLVPEAATIVLQGANGQGKTNLLEAVYLCATGRSFRQATPRAMLMHGADAGLVAAQVAREGVRHQVSVNLGPRQRSIRVDTRAVRHVAQLLELVNVVAFFPDDLRIARGSPEDRRRFLDRAVANQDAGFVRAALAYDRALRARNVLLRGQTPPERALLAAYDAQLIQHAGVLQAGRLRLLSQLAPAIDVHVHSMLGERLPLELSLSPGLEAGAAPAVPDADNMDAYAGAYADALAAALARSYPRDRARGSTSVGPHRADLLCQLAGRDLRTFASQGQQRACILAFKLAEVTALAGRLGSPPILLLDDVSSELDLTRSRSFFAQAQALECQIWVSTTGAVPLPIAGAAHTLTLCDGAFSP